MARWLTVFVAFSLVLVIPAIDPAEAQGRDNRPVGSIEINDGDAITNDRSVTLTLVAPEGMDRMRINNGPRSRGRWIPFQPEVTWRLPNQEGPAVVSVQFQGRGRGTSQVSTDSIILDRTAPTVSIDTVADGDSPDLSRTGAFFIGGTADDANGIAQVIVTADGQSVDVPVDPATGEWSTEASAPVSGTHEYTVTVIDAAGVATTETVTLDIVLPGPDAVLVTPELIVIDTGDAPADAPPADTSAVILAYDPATGNMTFQGDRTGEFTPGSVLVGYANAVAPNGFAVRVVTSQLQGTDTALTTVPAVLDEIFRQADFGVNSEEPPPPAAPLALASRSLDRQTTLALEAAADIRTKVTFNPKVTWDFFEKEWKSTEMTSDNKPEWEVTLDGRLGAGLDFVFDADPDFDWFNSTIEVKEFKAAIDLEWMADAKLLARDTFAQKEFSIGSEKGTGQKVFFVGFVPIFWNATFEPKVLIKADGEITVTGEIGFGLELGPQYKDGEWDWANNAPADDDLDRPWDLETRAAAAVTVTPAAELTLELYGTLGIGVDIGPEFKAGFTVTQPDRAKFEVTLALVGKPEIVGEIPILNKPIFDVDLGTIRINLFTIFEKTIFFEPPRLNVTLSGPDSLNVTGGDYDPNPFTINAVVSTEGDRELDGATVTLDLPPGLSLVVGSNPTQIGPIGESDEITVTWAVQATANTAGATRVFTVTATDDDATPGSDSLAVTLSPLPTLDVAVSATPSQLTIDTNQYAPDEFTVIATVRQFGPAPVNNVALTLDLPPGVSLAPGSPPVTQTVSTLIPNVPNGVTWTVSAPDFPFSGSAINYSVIATADQAAADTETGTVDLELAGSVSLRAENAQPSRTDDGSLDPNPVTVTAGVTNTSLVVAEDAEVTIELTPPLSLSAPGATQVIGDLAPIPVENTRQWQVAIPDGTPPGAYEYQIVASGTNFENRQVTGTITVPSENLLTVQVSNPDSVRSTDDGYPPFDVLTLVSNSLSGFNAENVTVAIELPSGFTVTEPTTRPIGTVPPTGAPTVVSWEVQAASTLPPGVYDFAVTTTSDNFAPRRAEFTVELIQNDDPPFSLGAPRLFLDLDGGIFPNDFNVVANFSNQGETAWTNAEVTLDLPISFELDSNESATKSLGTVLPGTTGFLSWRVTTTDAGDFDGLFIADLTSDTFTATDTAFSDLDFNLISNPWFSDALSLHQFWDRTGTGSYDELSVFDTSARILVLEGNSSIIIRSDGAVAGLEQAVEIFDIGFEHEASVFVAPESGIGAATLRIRQGGNVIAEDSFVFTAAQEGFWRELYVQFTPGSTNVQFEIEVSGSAGAAWDAAGLRNICFDCS